MRWTQSTGDVDIHIRTIVQIWLFGFLLEDISEGIERGVHVLDLCTTRGNWPDGHRRATSIAGLGCAGDEVKRGGERFEFGRREYVRGRVSPRDETDCRGSWCLCDTESCVCGCGHTSEVQLSWYGINWRKILNARVRVCG